MAVTNEQIILPGFNYAFSAFDAAFPSAVLGVKEGGRRDDTYRGGHQEGNDTRSPHSLPGGTLAARLLDDIFSIQRGQSNTERHGDKTKTDSLITNREARSDSGGEGGGPV